MAGRHRRRSLPALLQYHHPIDKRFVDELTDISYHSDHIERADRQNGHVRMAFLALHGCHRVNGVAAIHTEILKHEVLSEWYKLYPHKFVNKTNGITRAAGSNLPIGNSPR